MSTEIAHPFCARDGADALSYAWRCFRYSLGVWIGFDREKRGLHDLAGTYVVQKP